MRAGLPTLRLAAWLLVPSAIVCAGEPIRFSGRSGPAAVRELTERAPLLPAEARTDRGIARPELPMDMLAPGQSVTPTIGLTRRQLDEQDRRRNWMLQSPESLQQAAGNSATDRQREARANQRNSEGRENSPDGKQASGRQPDDDERTGDSPRGRNNPGPARKSERDRPAPRPAENGQADQRARTGWEARSSPTLRGGQGEGGWSDPGNARGGNMARALADARDRDRDRERAASLADFKRTFANPWAQTAGGAGLPSSPGGPTSGAGPSAPGGDFRRAAAGGLAGGGRSSMELGPRGGAGDFDPKNPLNYGAAGTVLRQPESPRSLDRKPIVLEVPKRKF